MFQAIKKGPTLSDLKFLIYYFFNKSRISLRSSSLASTSGVSSSAASSLAIFSLAVLIALTNMKIAIAVIKKSIVIWMKLPYLIPSQAKFVKSGLAGNTRAIKWHHNVSY